MNTHYLVILSAIVMMSITNTSMAQKGRHIDYAHVTQVTPIYQTIERRIPQERCHIETVAQRPHHRKSATGAIVGGVIGGVIGNEVGRGSDNKRLGAVVGSLLGMSIGNDVSQSRNNHSRHVTYRDVERCEISNRIETEQIVSGYNVRYRYQGKEFTAQTDEHPGKKIKIVVSVQPVNRKH